jgi:hypothetical protein
MILLGDILYKRVTVLAKCEHASFLLDTPPEVPQKQPEYSTRE